ncbi:MAG: AraC family transcriptional regulator [Bacteroidetes bacterium]|nr:AraC family transcriptional regulator [Bacteroidota bacterium]
MPNIPTELYDRISAAKVFIDAHYHTAINLDRVSQQACLSRYHFHRLFRQVYKKTPHQYISQKRISKAMSLLAENKSVTDVCNEVGFESVGSFSTLFKKEIGYPPAYYRNMAYQQKMEQQAEPRKAIPHCFLDRFFSEK